MLLTINVNTYSISHAVTDPDNRKTAIKPSSNFDDIVDENFEH